MNHLRQLLTSAAWVFKELGPAETLRRIRQRVLTLARQQTYARWIIECEAPAVQAALATPRANNGPLFSILMPVYNVEPRWLTQAIESVLAQTYPHFELCIVDDASPRPELAPLLRSYASREPRIKLHIHTRNGHISQTSNSALAMATGDFVALLDHDDLLPPYALELLARELARFPDADLLYSDEDKIDAQGRRSAPYFKPDFNYDLLLTQNMISHLGVYRTALVRSAGGFREGLEGSQDYDLALRVCEQTSPSRIRHLPYVLYHWRVIPGSTAMGGDQKPYALLAAGRAITDHLQRQGVQAEPLPGYGDTHRVKYALPEPPPQAAAASTGFWRSIAEGVVVAARSEQIWPVLLINLGVGVFYVGPFMAVLPLAVRDVYAGGALELSYVNLAFWAATILASMALVALARRLTLRGRLIAAAVSAGLVILLALSTLPPFPVFLGLIFVWGVGAGVTMTQSRTVVQIVAPASHRARLMSLFQLGLSGGGPIGAVLTGAICALWGLQAAMFLPAAGMALLVLAVLARSRLWSMRTVE